MPGITQEPAPDEALIGPHRFNDRGDRWYYTIDPETRRVDWGMSATTWLGKVIPKDEHLVRWMTEVGKEEASRRRNERAAYGSTMHVVFEEILKGYEWTSDYDDVDDFIEEFALTEDYSPAPHLNRREERYLRNHFSDWIQELNNDVRSFVQFVQDRDVRPIHMELFMVGHLEANGHVLRTGGTVDLVCELDWNGTRKRAIIDYKSGNIYPGHEWQLECYRRLYNDVSEDEDVEHAFNFRPKDWRKKPTYELKNQTLEGYEQDTFDGYVQVAATMLHNEPKGERIYEGSVGIEFAIEDTWEEISATDIVLSEHLEIN